MTTKNEEQEKAIQAWMEAKGKGTLELATGVGKTKIGIDVAAGLAWSMAEHLKQPSILILTPTETLRDDHWVAEAKKWDAEFLFKDGIIKTACIQSAYKWEKQTFDLVIGDEIHTMLSPEYSKFWINNTLHRILGLSATIPIEKRPLLDTIAPIIYTINPTEAKEKQLISEYKIFNIGIDFTPHELVQYQISDSNVAHAEKELMRELRIELNQVFDKARSSVKDYKQPSSVRMWSSRYLQGIRTRLSVCNNAENKVRAVCQILTKLKREKSLIFSESIKFAEAICKACKDSGCLTYHSKMKDDVRAAFLERFNDPASSVRCLSTVKALDMGVNVEAVSLCIIAAGSSNPLQFTQRLGRGVRRTDDDKLAVIINLYMKNTKEEQRVSKRLSNELTSSWVTMDEFMSKF